MVKTHTSIPPSSRLVQAIEEQGYQDGLAGDPCGSHHEGYVRGWERGVAQRNQGEAPASVGRIFIAPKWDCLECGGRGAKENMIPDSTDRSTLCPCVLRQLPIAKHLDAEVVLTERNELPWHRGRSMEGA